MTVEAAHGSFKAVKMSGKIKGTDRERHIDTERLRKGVEKRHSVQQKSLHWESCA